MQKFCVKLQLSGRLKTLIYPIRRTFAQHDSKKPTTVEEAIQFLCTTEFDVPIIIGTEHIHSGDEHLQRMPHNHKHTLARFSYARKHHIAIAIEKSLPLQQQWGTVAPSERSKIWRKAADIMDNRDKPMLIASIMLGQGKTQALAEEDVANLTESLRMNADYLDQLSKITLKSKTERVYASFHLRPLDGFVAAISPYNSTAMSANLAFSPALMGNCVIWKPSNNCMLSSFIAYKSLIKGGLPRGIISFMPSNSVLFRDAIAASTELSGVNFAGTTHVFREVWRAVSSNIGGLACFPRLVGECGANNFHFVHKSADVGHVIASTVKAAFEYSGQKCTSCTRIYVPETMWKQLQDALICEIKNLKMGDPTDCESYSSAVINESVFDKAVEFLKNAKESKDIEILCGGGSCKTLGYFIEPTMLLYKDPLDPLLTEEVLGPILNVHVYKDDALDATMHSIAENSEYAFTASIFANDDDAICNALQAFRMTAANIYINEKSTGSSMGHHPFAGNRLSGSNDKPGSSYFLLSWCSPQLVEETFPSESECS